MVEMMAAWMAASTVDLWAVGWVVQKVERTAESTAVWKAASMVALTVVGWAGLLVEWMVELRAW